VHKPLFLATMRECGGSVAIDPNQDNPAIAG
jgi:hypothetical protein